jgi:hypothetical protein
MVRTKLQHIRAVMDELKLPKFNVQDIKDDMTGPGAGVMLANEDLFPVSQQQEWFRQNYRPSNAAQIRSQLENLGLDFASLANYCAAGGQRAPEIKAINLIETEKNNIRSLHFASPQIGAYIVGDVCKQEGLVAAAMPPVFWSLFDPYATELLRYVIAGKQLLVQIIKNSTDPEDDEQAAFSAARFLTNRDIRAVRDNTNKMLEGFDLPTQSLMRHMGDWDARRIGSVLDWEAGEHEAASALMSRHSLGTSRNMYAADTNRKLEMMRNVSERYFRWLVEEDSEESSQDQTQGGLFFICFFVLPYTCHRHEEATTFRRASELRRKLLSQPRTATINTNNRCTSAACNIRQLATRISTRRAVQ